MTLTEVSECLLHFTSSFLVKGDKHKGAKSYPDVVSATGLRTSPVGVPSWLPFPGWSTRTGALTWRPWTVLAVSSEPLLGGQVSDLGTSGRTGWHAGHAGDLVLDRGEGLASLPLLLSSASAFC